MEVQLVGVQPRDLTFNVVSGQLCGQTLVMCPEPFAIGSVIVRYDDRIMDDSNIPFYAEEEVFGKVAGIPGAKRFTESAPEPVNSGLGHQGHGHLSVADVQVHRTCSLPAERLIGIEKLFNMPTFGKILS